MDNDEFKKIYTKIFRNISLWASQSYKRSLILIFILVVFGFPFIQFLQKVVSEINYVGLVESFLVAVLNSYDPKFYLLLFVLIVILVILYLLHKKLIDSDFIKDNFSARLNKWAIPLESSWITERCSDALGKMLTVTNATYPGTLKGAYGWYDYEISFLVKMSKSTLEKFSNFTIVVRSESNFNGVMFQVTKSHLRPHFIYNGTFIIDLNATQQLPTKLNDEEWIKVKIIVQGSDVEIIINDYKILYKIPTRVLNVANEIMTEGSPVTLEDLEMSNNDIKAKQAKVLDILRMPQSAAKEEAMKTVSSIMNSVPSFTKVILEYQKGSVGFRESGREQAHFRDFKIKRI